MLVEPLKVSKDKKSTMPGLVRKKLLVLSLLTLTLPTMSVLVLVLPSWDSVLSEIQLMRSQEKKVEEEEEVEEAEVAEVEEDQEVDPIDQKVVKEELTQSNPSRKPKKISQLYEREDLVDLPSKELAE